jgi:uncharacterized membrane protein
VRRPNSGLASQLLLGFCRKAVDETLNEIDHFEEAFNAWEGTTGDHPDQNEIVPVIVAARESINNASRQLNEGARVLNARVGFSAADPHAAEGESGSAATAYGDLMETVLNHLDDAQRSIAHLVKIVRAIVGLEPTRVTTSPERKLPIEEGDTLVADPPSARRSGTSDLVAIAYKDLPTAQEVAGNLGDAVKQHLIELEDVVIVERRPDGNVKLHQPSLAGIGAAGGALWGGLIGLIFFMPLFGIATGEASGAFSDTGIDDSFMRQLGENLPEGGAALILLIRKISAEKILPLTRIPGTIIQTSLSDEQQEHLREALTAAGQVA